MSWKVGLIMLGTLFVSFVIGVYIGESKRRTNHSARIWKP